ncbi:hypothetical protein F5051DRAFT_446068 [Lentinula edodes]|nr:hypothetical protein F5051DRAFT_446068 [Lentinula edodes]
MTKATHKAEYHSGGHGFIYQGAPRKFQYYFIPNLISSFKVLWSEYIVETMARSPVPAATRPTSYLRSP